MKKNPPMAVTDINEISTIIAIVFFVSEAIIGVVLRELENVPFDGLNDSPFAVAQAESLEVAIL